jgi:hypothetical protein
MAYFVYTYVFQIEYFDLLCSLSLYIVMAIGADDVFIWFDEYKQSAYEKPEISSTIETRFIWAWHKVKYATPMPHLNMKLRRWLRAYVPGIRFRAFAD